MSHIARCTTRLVNVDQAIMDETLRQVAERHPGAQVGVKGVYGVPSNARWSIGVPTDYRPGWNPTGVAGVAIVEDARGVITFVYDTDSPEAAALKAEIFQEYTALALKVALLRQGYSVQEAAGQPGARTVVGVRT
jgi:hypothetical protein